MSKRKQVTIPIEKIQEQDKYIEQIHRQMKNTSTELERETRVYSNLRVSNE